MNKTEFQSLPPDLQRDVRLAVALGWPLGDIYSGQVFDGVTIDDPITSFRRWKPTTDRSIWAGLLEVFPIAIAPMFDHYEVWTAEQSAKSTSHANLPTAIVCEVIRRDPLGHLARSGL